MQHSQHSTPGQSPYIHLVVMAVLSFIAMYVLMYAMVDKFDNVYNNINQAYMAGLMASPMVIIEIVVMKAMYRRKALNLAIIAVSVAGLVLFWMLIREQAGVGDEQFLRSMIPHHAGAILMCEESSITDPEIKELCETIKASQQSEIDQMNAMLSAR